MRIAFIIPAITAGGAERVVVRLANFISDLGFDVYVLVQRLSDFDYDLSKAVSLTPLPRLDAASIIEFVETNAVDIISDHFHWSLSHVREMAIVARHGIKVVMSEHNSYFYPLFQYAYEFNISGLDLFRERAALYRHFAAVTCLTRYSSNLLTSEGLGNVVLMYNPLSYESAVLSDLSAPRILTVSSFVKPAKRIDRLLIAFSEINGRYPGAKLRIVGEMDYPRFNMYCRAANIVGGSIEAIGISKNVSEHYLASSLFAMSSDIEGQPMVLLEAALHGLPQLVYDIPGIEDQIIHGETGYIVEQDNAVEFGELADNLLRDPEKRRRMGTMAREFVTDRFSLQKIGERWLQLIDAVSRAGAPSPELAWSQNSPEARQLRTDVAPEFNRWFQKALNPKKSTLVSVIVPVYGTEALLGRCLDSLINQTLKDIEIIVVDDNSPGNVAEIVDTYARRDSRIIFVEHTNNRGLYQARSSGAKIANGSYLAHVDSDDFVHPDFLRQLYDTAVVTGADIVECAAVEVLLDGSRRPIGAEGLRELAQPELLEAFVNEKMRHVVWNKLYRRTLWESTPLHMEEEREFNVTEDLLRNAPLFAYAKRYAYVERVLYYYVRRAESCVTDGDFGRMLRKLHDVIYVYDKVIAFFRAHGLAEVGIAKMRHREVNDLGWYMANGYKLEAERTYDPVIQVLDEFGIIGALATAQSQDITRLREVEVKYWDMVKKLAKLEDQVVNDAAQLQKLEANYKFLEEALAQCENGRIWERERAEYFKRQIETPETHSVAG